MIISNKKIINVFKYLYLYISYQCMTGVRVGQPPNSPIQMQELHRSGHRCVDEHHQFVENLRRLRHFRKRDVLRRWWRAEFQLLVGDLAVAVQLGLGGDGRGGG